MAGTSTFFQIWAITGDRFAPAFGPYYERDVLAVDFSPDSKLRLQAAVLNLDDVKGAELADGDVEQSFS